MYSHHHYYYYHHRHHHQNYDHHHHHHHHHRSVTIAIHMHQLEVFLQFPVLPEQLIHIDLMLQTLLFIQVEIDFSLGVVVGGDLRK